MRRSGMLLPVANLPSKYGIGTFSKEAYEDMVTLRINHFLLLQVIHIL